MSDKSCQVIWQTRDNLNNRQSKRDMFKFYNTLAGLVKALVNHYTVIDLRNESYVSGKIISTDGCMNIEMTDVLFSDPRGKKTVFRNFFLNGRNIRYVHIPKKLDCMTLIEEQLSSFSRKRTERPAHTFKKVRAERKQKEILMTLYEQRRTNKEREKVD